MIALGNVEWERGEKVLRLFASTTWEIALANRGKVEKLQGKQTSGAYEPLCTVLTVPTVNNNRSINLKMRTNPSNSERHRQKEVRRGEWESWRRRWRGDNKSESPTMTNNIGREIVRPAPSLILRTWRAATPPLSHSHALSPRSLSLSFFLSHVYPFVDFSGSWTELKYPINSAVSPVAEGVVIGGRGNEYFASS